jgi:ABC-type antimicrobial peptide transport system permease subunit
MDTADKGFNEENIVFIPLRGDQTKDYESIKTELLRSPRIKHVTTGSAVPGFVEYGEINWGLRVEENNALARILFVGYDFAETFDIKMEEGRFYSPEMASDSINNLIINQATVDLLGLESPIGEKFYLYDRPYTIIGVVENFHFFPIDIVGGKALIMPFQKVQELLFIKTTPGPEQPVMDYAKDVMASFNPLFPFEFYHLDDRLPPFMDTRDDVNMLLVYFSIFGILISCLGLYGLTIHTTERRIKEIGIRKTFGASSATIVALLSRGFLKLIIIANIIAIPLSYLLMNSVIQFFTNRIDLDAWLFIAPAIGTMLIALLTISGKSWWAAKQNPIESLKYE